MKQFFTIITLLLIFLTNNNMYSYWPGKWTFLDKYIISGSKEVPSYISIFKTGNRKLKNILKFDKKNRIILESYFRNKTFLGKTKYFYSDKHLLKIVHYSAMNTVIDKMLYRYDSYHRLKKIIIKKNNNKIDRTMLLKYKNKKLIRTEVFDFLKRKIVITKFFYNKNKLSIIKFYIPGEWKEKKIIQHIFNKGFLTKRIKYENSSSHENLFEYKNNQLHKILYLNQRKKVVMKKIITY